MVLTFYPYNKEKFKLFSPVNKEKSGFTSDHSPLVCRGFEVQSQEAAQNLATGGRARYRLKHPRQVRQILRSLSEFIGSASRSG